jgi:hypothetical protein
MDTSKLKKCILYGILILIFLYFVIGGVISSILISSTLSSIFFSFQILTIINLIILIVSIVIPLYVFKNSENKTKGIAVILSLLCVWLLLQLLIVGGLQFEYNKVIDNYSNTYQQFLISNPNDYLNASWNLTQKYYAGFDGTYNIIGANIPSRNLPYFPYSDPIFEYDMNSMGGFQRLLVAQQEGNCGEFSLSITNLLNDSTHYPTRVIYFEGIDHMMPEIYINSQWWAFDIDYLTPNGPISTYNFSKNIPEDARNDIAYIYSSSDRESSLLKEHGFNETNITIATILNMPANPSSGSAMPGVTVQLFTLNNSDDPLVSKGVTDQNGMYSTILNSDKDYWIFATYYSYTQNLVGLADLSNITSKNLSINVSITNYG